MTCTSCQAVVPTNANFCVECGTPVDPGCPQCGATGLAGARHCGACGAALVAAAAPPTTAVSAPGAPPQAPPTTPAPAPPTAPPTAPPAAPAQAAPAYAAPLAPQWAAVGPGDERPAVEPLPVATVVRAALGAWLVYVVVSTVGMYLHSIPNTVGWIVGWLLPALVSGAVALLLVRGRVSGRRALGVAVIVASYPLGSAVEGMFPTVFHVYQLYDKSVPTGAVMGVAVLLVAIAGAALAGRAAAGALGAIFVIPLVGALLALGTGFHAIGSNYQRGWFQFGGEVAVSKVGSSFTHQWVVDLSAVLYFALAALVAVLATRPETAPRAAGVGPLAGGGHAQPGYATSPGTNGFAIASLVLGILGGSVLGVVFGFVALSQIRRSGQGGRGMAIAGIVLSVLWLLATIGVFVALTTSSSSQGY